MWTTIRESHWLAAVAAIGLISVAESSNAHQQWLAPNFIFQSGESAWLSFDHTFGDRRFQPGSGPGSYYSWWIVGPDGIRRNVPYLFLGKTRTVGEVELTESGTYRIEAVEDQMAWTQIKFDGTDVWQPGTRSDFNDFEVVRSRVYFNKTVSYATLDSMDRALLAGTGDPLEILFDDHPNELYEDEKIRVRVLAFGEPLTNQEVRVFSHHGEGHDASESCSTDAVGYCEFEPLTVGRYLLATNTEGDSPDDEATDGFSHGYSVVIEVRSAGAPSTADGP